ncbi:DUF4843 domain-containing protein [Anditalea andensis]|uniref:DUF1735 domain-containing protein n=1 Tax=Anditalea andensis TaxID=1048983 RepID=A0A074KVT2_9BACT|nr:DUF4843 domain-containing protein [Anditalea andensis]KEO74081.1 hypothetical protein EL17_08020 [Anditalea andensis]
MKKHTYWIAVILITITSSCFENYEERYLFTDLRIEFQEAVVRNNAAGRDYPVLPLQPVGERGYQVNLFGGQLRAAENLAFRVDEEASTAVEGIHYSLPNDTYFQLEADSSFGEVVVEKLSFPSVQGQLILVLELIGNENIVASENHKRIGVRLN